MALLAEAAFAEPEVAAVIAHTAPDGVASQAVLTRCGFVVDGVATDPEDGAVLCWRLARG